MSFIFYAFILLIGSFFYLFILFSYGLFVPFHILLIWLMYSKFLDGLKSDLGMDKNLFALIPCAVQNLLFLIYLISTGDILASLGDFLFSWIGLTLLITSGLEFLILQRLYSGFLKSRS